MPAPIEFMKRCVRLLAAIVAMNALLPSARAYVMDSRRWDAGTITMHLNLDTAPLPRKLADGSTSWNQVAQQALAEWNAVIARSQFVAVPNSAVPVGKQNGVNNVFFSPTVYGEAWGTGVVGLTLTVVQGGANGRRVESDVLFNSNAPMDSYRGALGSAGPYYDFKRLALHEFGHVLGLGHPDDSGQQKVSVMNSAISDTDGLTDDDIEGAQSGYGIPAGYATGVAPSIIRVQGEKSVTAGATATFSVVAQGTAPFTYQWKKDGVALSRAAGADLVLTQVDTKDAGSYTVMISNAVGSVTALVSQLAVLAPVEVPSTVNQPETVTVEPSQSSSRISNLSVRSTLAAGQTLVVGLTAAGKPHPVLVRAVGPTLSAFGLTDALPDPAFSLFKDGASIDANDNWGGTAALSDAFVSVGAFALPASSLDAALVRTIEGGNTVQVIGQTGGTVLVEAYEMAASPDARLINVSARNRVGRGSEALVAGFTISGEAGKTVVIRGIGPTLAAFGVGGVLADPKLELYAGASKIGENDSWDAAHAATFANVGAFALPAGSKDAALVVTLAPGSYTVQLSGSDGGTGEGMIEVYEVQ